MVRSCFVVGCTNSSIKNPDISFHKIPTIISDRNKKYQRPGGKYSLSEIIELSKERQKAWIHAIRRGDLSESQIRNANICGDHFLSGKAADITEKNHPDWVPCVKLGYKVGAAVKVLSALERHRRQVKRNSCTCDDFEMEIEEDVIMNDFVEEMSTETEKASQTGIKADDLKGLFEKLVLAEDEKESMKKKLLKFELTEESFVNNDSKTLYYTGLSSSNVLFSIHKRIADRLYQHGCTVLSTFQQLLSTLLKLRLNLAFTDLSYRFGVSVSTASRYFYKCLNVLYFSFKCLIHWPDRNTLHKTMPECFKESFGDKVIIIIDCFEIFIEKPNNLYSCAQCWSNYKHHKTVKILLGMTPQGTVSYISEAWGGRASRKHVTEHCGLLDYLEPGSLVLADRGFQIDDMVQMVGAELNIPAFTKGKSQLHPTELERSRNISEVRIHVERIIGSVRQKYTILTGILPITMLAYKENEINFSDKIVTVCCVLVNLCPAIVHMT